MGLAFFEDFALPEALRAIAVSPRVTTVFPR